MKRTLLLVLVVFAATVAAVAGVLTVRSRDEIERYRALSRM
jgi:hypothetical protein